MTVSLERKPVRLWSALESSPLSKAKLPFARCTRNAPARRSPELKSHRLSLIRSQTRAAAGVAGLVDSTVEQSVALLKEASATRAVPSASVFQALLRLEKEKLPADSWPETLGTGNGGRRWRLIFTSGAKDVKEGSKEDGKGGGFYFPLTAVQRWEQDSSVIENGIFLGQLAAFAFEGPYEMAGRKLSFDFLKLKLRVGPKWFSFNIKSGKSKQGSDPFFLFFYVDDDIAAARGRGGGFALWQRTTADWELKAGVTL